METLCEKTRKGKKEEEKKKKGTQERLEEL
jgi:hypothetical protein